MSKILYLPVVRRKFDADFATKVVHQTKNQLQDYDLIAPDEALGDPQELGSFLSSVQENEIAGIIFQNTTFTDAEFIQLVQRSYPTTPILLLAPREPSIHGWLHLNALTGLMSSGNYLNSQKHSFEHIYGNPDETSVQQTIDNFVATITVKDDLAHLNIGVVGTFPPGFFFSDADAQQLELNFGVYLKHYQIDEAFEQAQALQPNEYQEELDYAQEHYNNLNVSQAETIRFVKYVTLMKRWAKKDQWGALASRCWPDFFLINIIARQDLFGHN